MPNTPRQISTNPAPAPRSAQCQCVPGVRACLATLILALLGFSQPSSAQVSLPNGGVSENVVDLRVKTVGGLVTVDRQYEEGRWRINLRWSPAELGGETAGSVSCRAYPELKIQGRTYLGDGQTWLLENRYSARVTDYFAGSECAANRLKTVRWQDRTSGNWMEYERRSAGDLQLKLVRYGDRNNVETQLTYDDEGRLQSVLDHYGKVVLEYRYNGEQLVEIRDNPALIPGDATPARTVKYSYTQVGGSGGTHAEIETVTDVLGHETRYGYSGAYLSSITDAEGRVRRYAYTADRVTKYTDADGEVTSYVYDYDRVKKEFYVRTTYPATAAGSRIVEQWYDTEGRGVRLDINGRSEWITRSDTAERVETATNARGLNHKTTRNEFDQIVRIQYPDGAVISQKYSAQNGQMTERTDELGVRTQYQHDSRGNLIQEIRALGLAEQQVTDYERNSLGLVEKVTRRGRTESNGMVSTDATWLFEYDALANLVKTTDPEGAVRRYTYDRAGNLLRYVDPLGNETRFEVDAVGNLTKVTDALGQVRRYAYDKLGNEVASTDARGKTYRAVYDAMSRNTQLIDPSGGVFQTQYDALGQPTHEVDEDGRSTQVVYDNFQRLLYYLDGKGNKTEYGYQSLNGDGLGSLMLPTETKYPTYTEQQYFDERERLQKRVFLNSTTTGVEGLVSTSKYDKRGGVIETTDANGKTSYVTYDALGRTSKFTNSLGNNLELTWDGHDKLIQVKDYNGNVTRFEYDRSGRLTKEIFPLGQTTTYTYNAKGYRETVTNPAGSIARYTYDVLGRLVRSEFRAAGQSASSETYTFEYDAEDNLLRWSDGSRSANFSYDDLGRLLSETVDYGNNVSLGYSYTYTAAGYVKSLTYPDGAKVDYDFDAHGQLATINIPGEGSISVEAWNWLAPKKLILPGGTTRELTQDGLLNLTGLKVKNPGQQTIFEVANQFGKNEEIKKKILTDSTGSASSTVVNDYTFDAEQRLTQSTRDSGGFFGSTSETFGYDAANNRVTHSAVAGTLVYDANNRLTQRGDTSYQYDASGNLIRKATGSSGAANTVTRYRYDLQNRLIEVQDGAGATLVKYAYDPFDNRLLKELHRDENGVTLATPKRILYLYGDEGLLAEADASGTVQVQYGWKPDGSWSTDPVFIKTAIKADGETRTGYAYFHNDHLGTPLRATDKSGRLVWRADYDSYGLAMPAADNAIKQNLRLAGQYFDAETALHYNTRRYYDPQSGRYITTDPQGVAGGWNLYSYANADPANQLDPTGEWVWVAIRVAITVYDIYTTYQEIQEQGLCFDWTRLIPIPVKVPRIKWLTKRVPKCSDPCECMSMGGGRKHSFPPDTLVHALDESGNPALRSIASLKLGDKVLAKSEWKAEAESLSYEPVTDIHVTPDQKRRLVDITLTSGQRITATDGHPFRTTEGWRDAILLKKGGKLLLRGEGDTEPERAVEIADIQHRSETLTTYNLEVANAHTFFVGEEGGLVHNGFGAYTIHFPDGTRYHGKGDYNRAKKSARRVGRVTGNYPCRDYEKWIDWVDAIDDAESFRKEHARLSADGGPQNSSRGGDGRNHNKIWGPGRYK